MASARIQVKGRVQGVWFRKHTAEKAYELGLVGTVQNLVNGDVLINATGTGEQLKQLEQWCWQGSPLSDVSDVTVTDLESRAFADFRIVE